MSAVYVVPTSRRKAVLAVIAAACYPTLMAWNLSKGLDWQAAVNAWGSWLLLAASLCFLAFGIRAALRASKPGRFEREGSRITIFAGHGVPDCSGLTNAYGKDAGFSVDLSEAYLEWAGNVLNLRTREHGTLPLGFGDAAKPLADWLAANGHPPVKAY